MEKKLCKRRGFFFFFLYQKKQKRLKIEVFEPIGAGIFTHIQTCIKNPCWQSDENSILLYSLSWQCSYFRGTDSILDEFLFIFFVILSESKVKQRRKIFVTKI